MLTIHRHPLGFVDLIFQRGNLAGVVSAHFDGGRVDIEASVTLPRVGAGIIVQIYFTSKSSKPLEKRQTTHTLYCCCDSISLTYILCMRKIFL